jgi:hypothetical protein
LSSVFAEAVVGFQYGLAYYFGRSFPVFLHDGSDLGDGDTQRAMSAYRISNSKVAIAKRLGVCA